MARPSAPFTQQPLAEVLEQLAEHTPGPGGGAAAAWRSRWRPRWSR